MKLSEIKKDEALDVLADILEPASQILTDEKIKELFQKESKLKLVSYILKNHKSEIIEIMARLDGEEPEDYTFSLIDLPKKVLEILNDEALKDLFTSQAQLSD